MEERVGNFSFLERHSPQLAKLGRFAERYFADDPPAALIKLRQFAEIMAKNVAAQQALLSPLQMSFDEVLRTLRSRSIMQRDVAELFYHLKRVGNIAAHEDRGTPADALTALKIARAIGIWFHQTYGNDVAFKPGPFIPPAPPADATAALRDELAHLKQEITTSADAQAKAQLAAQEAEAERRRLEDQAQAEAQERAFWEQYAAETEAALRAAERMEIDEATTRVLIDELGLRLRLPRSRGRFEDLGATCRLLRLECLFRRPWASGIPGQSAA